MVRFYIVALILTFYQASSSELTSDETQVDQIETSEPSTDGYSKDICAGIETQFQNYVINIIDSVISTSAKSYNCLMDEIRNNNPDCKKINLINLENLKDYRKSLKKLYQEIANHWVREKSKLDARFKECLDLPVQFERNIRIVRHRVSSNLKHHECLPIIDAWPRKINESIPEYLDGKQTTANLNQEEIADFKAFHYSPLKRIISTEALFDTRLTNLELRQKLALAYNAIEIGIEKLKKKISTLKDHQKYILFDFESQFAAFTNTLPDKEKAKATSCIESSGFFRDCTINVLNQGSRCGSRIWNLGKELLPIISLIDSIGGMGEVMAAEVSQVMTSSEATQRRSELATMGVLGLGGLTAGEILIAKPLFRSIFRTGSSRITRRRPLILSPFYKKRMRLNRLKRSGVDLKKQLTSSHIKATTRLKEMGVNYSPVSDLNSYAVRLAERNTINTKNIDPADLFNLSDIPIQAQGVLRIRGGATKGRRHNNPRDLALKHRDIDARIKEAEQMGVKVVVDTSLDSVRVKAYYSRENKILVIRSDSNWLTFEHEFQHALFDKYLIGHTLEDSPLDSVRLIARSGQTLKQMREQLPAQIRRNWPQREQDVILRYMRDDMPELALNERLSVNRELELLGWRRYTPFGQRISNYATRHLIDGLERAARAGPLTAPQESIRKQAYMTHYAQTYGIDAAIISGGVVGGSEIIKDLDREENSILLNLPENIRSAIQLAKEVFYSERGILVKDQNGQVQLFPSEKKE